MGVLQSAEEPAVVRIVVFDYFEELVRQSSGGHNSKY